MDIKEAEREMEEWKRISQADRVKLSERLEDILKAVEWGREQQRLIQNRESVAEIKEFFNEIGLKIGNIF